MRYRITHRTEYRYSEPVDSGYNEARLLPRALDRQQVLCASLAIDPPASDQRERSDYFGNRVVAFSLDRPHRSLTVTSSSEVVVEPRAPVSSTGMRE